MRRYIKPTILILCLTALVAVAATETNINYTQVAEDINIMARIIDKTLAEEFPNEYRASSLFNGHRGCQGIYLKNYGAIFMTSVGFPVAEQTEEEHKESTPDDLWQQTKYELKGGQTPGISFANISGNNNTETVEQLKEELLRLIGMYAPNIRQLSSQENVVVAVRGTQGFRVSFTDGNVTGRKRRLRFMGNYEEAVSTYKKTEATVVSPTVPRVPTTRVMTAINVSNKGTRSDTTTLIVKVNKKSITEYKDGNIDFASFMEQAEITQY